MKSIKGINGAIGGIWKGKGFIGKWIQGQQQYGYVTKQVVLKTLDLPDEDQDALCEHLNIKKELDYPEQICYEFHCSEEEPTELGLGENRYGCEFSSVHHKYCLKSLTYETVSPLKRIIQKLQTETRRRKKKKRVPLSILDLSPQGDLGGMDYVLANYGHHVTLVERDPILYSIMSEEMEEKSENILFRDTMARISMLQVDPFEYLEQYPVEELSEHFDCVFIRSNLNNRNRETPYDDACAFLSTYHEMVGQNTARYYSKLYNQLYGHVNMIVQHPRPRVKYNSEINFRKADKDYEFHLVLKDKEKNVLSRKTNANRIRQQHKAHQAGIEKQEMEQEWKEQRGEQQKHRERSPQESPRRKLKKQVAKTRHRQRAGLFHPDDPVQ